MAAARLDPSARPSLLLLRARLPTDPWRAGVHAGEPTSMKLILAIGLAVPAAAAAQTADLDTVVITGTRTAVTADQSLSAHFEHTVAITPQGPEILTLAG